MKMIKLLPLLSLLIAAAYWLPRLVRWILEPDYLAPRRREQKIDMWIERILQ